jgi:hypothetical protein
MLRLLRPPCQHQATRLIGLPHVAHDGPHDGPLELENALGLQAFPRLLLRSCMGREPAEVLKM